MFLSRGNATKELPAAVVGSGWSHGINSTTLNLTELHAVTLPRSVSVAP